MSATGETEKPTDSLIDTIVDSRYKIKKKIGEGGIGAVYLAVDEKMMNRQVVVKILLENWLKEPEIRRKFEHEKEALSRLDHPGIVGILDAGVDASDMPYIVMPFVAGRTLGDILKENHLPSFAFCADVIESVAESLSVAHASGILHRDVKPENIIVEQPHGKKPRVRLIDFGIARVHNSQVSPVTHVERSIGTVWYVAPEQLLGSIVQTSAADIFSLGVVAFEMLTGERPFDPQTVLEMVMLHKEGLKLVPSEINCRLSSEVDSIIAASLAFDPNERYNDAADFGYRLVQAIRQLDSPKSSPIIADSTKPSPTVSITGPDAWPESPEPAMPSVETKFPETEDPVNPSSGTGVFRNRLMIALIGLAAILVLGLGMAVLLYSSTRPTEFVGPPKPVVVPHRVQPSLKISFEILEKSGIAPDEKPAFGIERKVFKTGDRIRMSIESALPGNLYLLNEDFLESGKSAYYLLFPTAIQQTGFPQIDAGQPVTTGPIPFTGEPGKEVVWVVWTQGSVVDLEEARINALESAGEVKDSKKVQQLKKFLASYSPEKLKLEVLENQTTLVTGTDDLIIYRMELEHR